MMSKRLITIIVVACIAVMGMLVLFMKRSADIARYRSDRIMEQFKSVDSILHKTDKGLDSLNKMHFDSLIKANK